MALPLCYHGYISKKECEDLLGKKNKDGAYLIRQSESIQGAMCLCVFKNRVVYTYRILQAHNGSYTLLTAGGLEETYLDDLIRNYKRKNQGLAMHLRHAVKKTTSLLIQTSYRQADATAAATTGGTSGRTACETAGRTADASAAQTSRRPSSESEMDHDYENNPSSDYVEVLPD